MPGSTPERDKGKVAVVTFPVHCDKQVVKCSVAAVYQLAILLDHEQTAIQRQFSSLRAVVSCTYSLCCEGHAENRQLTPLM